MSDEPIREDEENRSFGWAGARRRLSGGEGASGENRDPLKLRPSSNFQRPQRRWGVGTEPPVQEANPAPAGNTAPAAQPAQPPAPGRPPVELRQPRAAAPVAPPTPVNAGAPARANPQTEAAKIRLHELLIEEMEQGSLDGLDPAQQREAVKKAARELIVQENLQVGGSRDELVESVADEVLGLGPLEPLLRNPDISEVMVIDLDRIFYELNGKILRSTARFRDVNHAMRIIERIVAPLGRRIDEASPMVDARLADGSRVNITIPPVSPKAPTITIRKFRADKMRMGDLIAVGSMSEETAEFLAMCVRAHMNIIISGGTGTGKTTLLNALSSFIPNTERIITIEDPAELRLQQEHVITMEGRPPSVEGKHAVSQRDLVKNTLRMRPDRIIVGEVRGGEAFDMLQAMNTGHDGSISTVHANTPRDAVARLENMVLMAGMELPARAIREQIASAIHVFIQVTRLQDGSRRVSHVTEVSGMEGDTVTLQDIFKFELDHVDQDGKVHGAMRPSGIRPNFAEKFALAGIELRHDIFDREKGGHE